MSFILPCSIGNLTVRNALVDLGVSISIMPLSMYKQLGLGKLKPVNMTVEITDRAKSIRKGIVENLLVKIDNIIFPIDCVILDMVEDFRMPIIIGRPLLATAHAETNDTTLDQGEPWDIETVDEPNNNKRREIDPLLWVKPKVYWCKEILQQKGETHEFWVSCDPYNDQCDGGDVSSNEENKSYWTCMNDDEKLDVAWEGMRFNDWVRVSHGKVRKMTEETNWKDYWRQDLKDDSDYENEGNLIDKELNMTCTQEENSYMT
ncbi:DNA-binding pseudobarrel domain-containing protein [Tanacetum coccineum]|uniref:DNA-binding pseudobarrel domain-containing protein n=1 Tax=Tanacetum coccineum TaxID=301880 RepID=A0ABQ5HU93_9ASTR